MLIHEESARANGAHCNPVDSYRLSDCALGRESDRPPDSSFCGPLRLVTGAVWWRGDRQHRAPWRGPIPGRLHPERHEGATSHVRASTRVGAESQLGPSEQF